MKISAYLPSIIDSSLTFTRKFRPPPPPPPPPPAPTSPPFYNYSKISNPYKWEASHYEIIIYRKIFSRNFLPKL